MWIKAAGTMGVASAVSMTYVIGSRRFFTAIDSGGEYALWAVSLLLIPAVVAAPFCFPFRGIRWVGALIALGLFAQTFSLAWMNVLSSRFGVSQSVTHLGDTVLLDIIVWLAVMGPFAGLVTWIRVLKSIRGKSAPLGPPPSEDPKYYPLTRV